MIGRAVERNGLIWRGTPALSRLRRLDRGRNELRDKIGIGPARNLRASSPLGSLLLGR